MSIEHSPDLLVDVSAVWEWVNNNGEYPGDELLAAAVRKHTAEWLLSRRDGMDALASAYADWLSQLTEAMLEA